MLDPGTGRAAVRFAISARDPDGWYSEGQIRVDSQRRRTMTTVLSCACLRAETGVCRQNRDCAWPDRFQTAGKHLARRLVQG